MRNFLIILSLLTLQSCIARSQSYDGFKNKESEGLFKQANDLQDKGQLDSALVYFDKADKLAPNTAIILHERGLLKSNMAKYDESLLDLSKSIELTSDQKKKEIFISNRGLVYMEMGNMTGACHDWRKSGEWGRSYIEKYCK